MTGLKERQSPKTYSRKRTEISEKALGGEARFTRTSGAQKSSSFRRKVPPTEQEEQKNPPAIEFRVGRGREKRRDTPFTRDRARPSFSGRLHNGNKPILRVTNLVGGQKGNTLHLASLGAKMKHPRDQHESSSRGRQSRGATTSEVKKR